MVNLVRAAALSKYAEVARQYGLNPVSLLRKHSMSLRLIADPERRIPILPVLAMPRETTKMKLLDALDEQAKDFIKASPFLMLATADAQGCVDVSPKGDLPGFVEIEDDCTVLLPDRTGNNLAFGLENIIATGQAGVIFLRPGTGETLRLNGRAEIFDDADLLARLGTSERPALLAIRIHIERCYFHCARSVLRHFRQKIATSCSRC